MIGIRLGRALMVAALSAGGVGLANAEPSPQPVTPQASSAQPPAGALQIPDGPVLSMLIRRTLLTLNDANLSGNYTVFRDLAAPGFQAANDAARLGAIFTELRQRRIDLAPIVHFDPKLVRAPQIDANNMLHVSGFIPTRPEQVNFDLLFQQVSGRWRVFGIAVNTSPAADTLAAPAVAPAKPIQEPVKKAEPAAEAVAKKKN